MLNGCSQSGILGIDVRFAHYFLLEFVKEQKNLLLAINYDTACKLMVPALLRSFESLYLPPASLKAQRTQSIIIFPLPLRGRQWKSLSTYEPDADNNNLNQPSRVFKLLY